MATELYERYIAAQPEGDIQRQVWDGTPWMVNAWTGMNDDHVRWHLIARWLYDTFGQQAYPFSEPPRPGRFFIGCATVMGWTWIGFDTEDAMLQFQAMWPDPEAREAAHG